MRLSRLLWIPLLTGLWCLGTVCGHAGDRSALLVIDVQKDYTALDSGSRVCPEQIGPMISTVNRLIPHFADQKNDVIYILQNGGGPLNESLKTTGDLKFIKNWPSAFSNVEFEAYLKKSGARKLYITGLAAEFCVGATARDARSQGYDVTIVSNAVAAKNCDALKSHLLQFKRERIKIIDSDQVNSAPE